MTLPPVKRIYWLVPVPLLFGPLGWLPLTEWMASHLYCPVGFTMAMSFVAMLPGVPLCIAMLLGPFGLFAASTRKWSVLSLVCLIAWALGMGGGDIFRHHVRKAGLKLLESRFAPVIEAILAFEADTGKPPDRLDYLVPKYLDSTPKPGLRSFPSFDYIRAEDPARYDGNAWILHATVGNAETIEDHFYYFPNQNYPDRAYGCRLRHLEKWAILIHL
jgi:hypothetical protein